MRCVERVLHHSRSHAQVPLPTLPEGVGAKLPSVDLSAVDFGALRSKGLGGVVDIVKNAAAAAKGAAAKSAEARK